MDLAEARLRAKGRLRVLLIVLAASAVVAAVGPTVSFSLDSFGVWLNTSLKPWVTEEMVLGHVRTKHVYHLPSHPGAGDFYELDLAEGKISSLKYWARDPDSIEVHFDFEQGGKTYRIEGGITYLIVDGDAGFIHDESLGEFKAKATQVSPPPL